MKCPKCGYTSFDYLDECKKCGSDLSTVRSILGVIAVSPDEIALSTPTGGSAEAYHHEESREEITFEDTRPEPEMPLIQRGGYEQPPQEQIKADQGDEDIFGSLVQPTSYTDDEPEIDIFGEEPAPVAPVAPKAAAQPKPPEPPPPSPKEEEDEFLDLDFGSIFEDDEKK